MNSFGSRLRKILLNALTFYVVIVATIYSVNQIKHLVLTYGFWDKEFATSRKLVSTAKAACSNFEPGEKIIANCNPILSNVPILIRVTNISDGSFQGLAGHHDYLVICSHNNDSQPDASITPKRDVDLVVSGKLSGGLNTGDSTLVPLDDCKYKTPGY